MEVDDLKDIEENIPALVDLLQGNSKVYNEELSGLDLSKLQRGLELILNNGNLTDRSKADFIANSWRINYREKPPTPEEFLTEKYIGRMAPAIYPRVKLWFIEFFNESKPYLNAVLYPYIGAGKEILNTCSVMTYREGYKQIGNIQVGDIVCNPNGGTSKVVGVYPQGIKNIYEITFKDGRKTYAGLEHLWKASKSTNSKIWNKKTKQYNYVTPYRLWKTCTTKDIIDNFEQNPKARWCIPLTKPVLHEEEKHIIPPYTLGALLGDGYLSKLGITICGNDKGIFDNILGILQEGKEFSFCAGNTTEYKVRFMHSLGYKDELQRLDLLGTRSLTKFIPKEYLFDSIENRISLLQGLMDTDGTADKEKGRVSFSTISLQLANDICFLVRGLGGLASINSQLRKKTYKGITKESLQYRICIQFPSNAFPIFSLRRKQERVNKSFDRDRNRSNTQYLFIQSIKKVESGEATCIRVDHPDGLFLTDDYIVTHNSTLAVLINLYICTHIALMRDPRKYLNQAPNATLAFVLGSFSMKKGAEILLEPFIKMLEISEFFTRLKTKDDMTKSEEHFQKEENIGKIFWTTASIQGASQLQFSNGIQFKLISNTEHLLGLTILCGTMTELAFFREAGKDDEYILRFFNDLKGRIYSRMKNNYWGRSILDSSPNDLESPIDKYCMYEAENDPTNYVVKGARWDWEPETYKHLDDRFPVFKGGNGKPPVILTSSDAAKDYQPDDILMVPKDEFRYFHDSLRKSLKDIAGIPQGNLDKIFYDYQKIEECFLPQLKSIEFCLKADAKQSPYELLWKQIRHEFFIASGTGWHFYYKPRIPRVFHIDQSLTTDMTCVAFCHVERKPPRPGMAIDLERDVVYVIDFVIPIHPFGGRINLDAVRELITDVYTKGGIPIVKGTFDIFESSASQDYLTRFGLDVEHLSVDDSLDPYMFLAQVIEQGNLKIGRNIFFKNNLKSLRMSQTKVAHKLKVDHTMGDTISPALTDDIKWESSLLGLNAKDVSDAVCGAVYNAKQYLAIDGQSLSQMWDESNIILTPEYVKKKAISQIKEMGFLIS